MDLRNQTETKARLTRKVEKQIELTILKSQPLESALALSV